MTIYTIGFTQKSAKDFFELLRESGAMRVIDVRLNNASQLAGFTKRGDLSFFLSELCDMDYLYELRLAPRKPMLDAYQKGTSPWVDYERSFLDLLAERRVEQTLSRELLEDAVLLCSEPTAGRCHRRLVAEYLADRWGDVKIAHL